MTEFGNVALVEEREDNEGGKVALRLPGVRKGDMASRNIKPEVRVFSLQFSPTGGIKIYDLNRLVVFQIQFKSLLTSFQDNLGPQQRRRDS